MKKLIFAASLATLALFLVSCSFGIDPSAKLKFVSDGNGSCYVSGIGVFSGRLDVPAKSPAGDSVTGIGSNAFYGCKSLTGITIPGGVTNIGSSAFYNCTALKSVAIPDSVTGIGEAAFADCTALISLTLPTGVTAIEDSAFNGCSSLASVTIPGGVTHIGARAFYHCSSLTNITFQGTKAQWNAISKGAGWNPSTGSYVIHCTDGDIAKE